MVRVRARAAMTPLDVDAVAATAAAVLEQLRGLSFVAGGVVHPETGVLHAGLRDLTGTHPRAGTQYRAVAVDEAGTRENVTVELLQDDRRQWRARLGSRDGDVDITVADPSDPRRAQVSASVAATGRGYFDGAASVDATVDLAAGAGGVPRRPLTADVRHRRVRASVDARVSADWDVDVSVRANGRGLLRPAVAVAALFLSRRVARELQARLAATLAEVDVRSARLTAAAPETIARELVCQLVDEAAVGEQS